MTTSTDSMNGSTRNYPGTPRWVKVFGIIALVLLLLVVLRLTGVVAGDHGPGRHIRSGHGDIQTAPSSEGDVTPTGHADRHAPPERGH